VCYRTFSFNQQLSLYSVINEDDVQIIKIFDDKVDDSTIDCEVTHIDGRPSMKVIREFADLLAISRDAGVRFNSALTGLRFNGTELIEARTESFTFRNIEIPEKSSVEYSIICANNTSTKFTREWKITTAFYNVFETSKDYWNIFCLSTALPPMKRIIRNDKPKIYSMRECKMVYNTSSTKFFKLSDNKTGVIVITTVNPPDYIEELLELQRGFNSLEDEGVQKVSIIQIIYSNAKT
jgi:hypothetical protein